jgi:lysylphosphatidylglycerol synthetase-like protein (DUF2156 family)
MKRKINPKILALSLGYLLLGLIAESYKIPKGIIFISIGILYYMVRSEGDGFFLTGLWITGLISCGVLQKSWIAKIPWPNVQIVLGSLLTIWIFALSLIFISGQVLNKIAQSNHSHKDVVIHEFFGIILSSFVLGYFLSTV